LFFIRDGKCRFKMGFRQGSEEQMMPVLISTSHHAAMLTLKTVKFMLWKAGSRVTRRTIETMHALRHLSSAMLASKSERGEGG
jgi:hypothetical protein